ncbi:MAG: protein kinase [Planctomycetota bacterium]
MNLEDLPASEIARIDAVCLEYEVKLRDGDADFASDEWVDHLVRKHGGQNGDVLRAELLAVRAEVSGPADMPNALRGNTDTPPLEDPTLAMSSPPEAPSADETSAVPDVASQTDTPLPSVGETVGPYSLTGILGQGGMGIVYQATDKRLNRSVAIKMLSVSGRHRETLTERFHREARAVAALSHPNIVELFDVGSYQGMPYAVMEHLRGITLLQRMSPAGRSQRAVKIAEVRSWGLQLAEALATAHEQGVVHRDLKPENVMLVPKSQAASGLSGGVAKNVERLAQSVTSEHDPVGSESILKLFDFGLSRVADENAVEIAAKSLSEDASISAAVTDAEGHAQVFGSNVSGAEKTRIGMILGTPGYMAPEQARGESIGPSVDLFALGCVLFEAFYERPAFAGKTPATRFAAALAANPSPDPGRRRDDIALADLIAELLKPDPSQRPSAAEVARQLRETDPNLGSSDGTMDLPAGSIAVSRRKLLAVGGLGAATFAGLGAWLAMRPAADLSGIRRLGVLKFTPSDASNPQLSAISGVFDEGDLLAGLVVNELSRMSGVEVTKYVPIVALEPQELIEAASRLDVDAIVTGTLERASAGGDAPLDVNAEIVSGATGKLLWSKRITIAAANNRFGQTILAKQIANAVGRRIDEAGAKPPSESEAFSCLIKGRVRSDPDSTEDLRIALMCFEHAIQVDPKYADAHAGIALTKLAMAERTKQADATSLVQAAQASLENARRLEPENPSLKLAEAMMGYQWLEDYNGVLEMLQELSRKMPNDWQTHHQLGWVQLMHFQDADGVASLRRASRLHPTSQLLRTDLTRAHWFTASPTRAINEATATLETHPDSTWVRGLLIDIHESLQQWEQAAAYDPVLASTSNMQAKDYFAQRASRLLDVPYGPYGPELNQAILAIRNAHGGSVGGGLSQLLTGLIQQPPLWFSRLLCRHPTFAFASSLPQAVEYCPLIQPNS